MSARKIRMTSVGLVAMPAGRDERTVAGEHLATDPDLCTAWSVIAALWEHSDSRITVVRHVGLHSSTLDRLSDARRDGWQAALIAIDANSIEGIRAALTRARDAAAAAGYSTEHEDAALAMLPPVAGRRAA